ncbi:hypothetical protein NITMOv2_2493 [Nitrospira moscoviensis]|uniref:Secreted protein n=2 Tax=Nitrospira moscoviensis TaxID=42253 RepID=A0A0K2GD85_NITMO|nr:hypothetical protein NITMOv2_2493 [Nitrospira moscoviensis]
MVLLCLCVMVQMLGVPATLLSPDGPSDLLGASVLEGFALLPPVIDLAPSSEAETASDTQYVPLRPLLITVPFHPPVLSIFG